MELRRGPLVATSAVLVLFILAGLLTYPPTNRHGDVFAGKVSKDEPRFHAPRHNVWAELTKVEAAEVNDFILEEFKHLNLTKHPKSAKDNFVFAVETLKPNKTDTVAYLYQNISVPPPERWAKATLSHQIDGSPYMAYYMVGPLPITTQSKIMPLIYPFNSGRNYVSNPVTDYIAIQDFGLAVAENMSDITQDLLGASVHRDNSNSSPGLGVFPRGSRTEVGGLTMWMQFYRPGESSGARTILPQGLYGKVDASASDMSQWTIGQWYYNGIIYDSAEDLRAALKDPGFKRTTANVDGHWTDTEDFESHPAGRELPPPVSVQPYGPRYKLDRKEQYVSWFGFEFYLTTAQATGVSLFDIRFKGERVMYELGLQKAMAHYAGDDPMQGGLEVRCICKNC